MSGTKFPAVRLPALGGERDGISSDGVVVELPPSNKFGFAWPAEGTTVAPAPPTSDRTLSLSSSDAESELSEAESISRADRRFQMDVQEEGHDITPRSRMNLDQNPIEQVVTAPTPPRLSRACSMPHPHQLGHLQNPRRMPSDYGEESTTPLDEQSSSRSCQCHEISLELADSVQMVIQTLLQLSPPQVLDPAKEQFSACSLSIPTPSISAMFTSMKNLNYMSANMSAFSSEPSDLHVEPPYEASQPSYNDFDVGEMLQSVGDVLSGVAAQAGVDLVLFHHDVGVKHVSVKGDECGISYALSHIVRQVIATARRGDTIEMGLAVRTQIPSSDQLPVSTDSADGDVEEDTLPVLDLDAPIRCVFDIVHKVSCTSTPPTPGSPENKSPSTPSRSVPQLDSLLLRRLLRHIGASLDSDLPSATSKPGRLCRMTLFLERGDPSAVNPAVDMETEDSPYYLFPEIKISREPTLEELLQFVETLRGKKVDLYASAKGSFAHHLTSYLTAWGLDVRHVSPTEGSPDRDDSLTEHTSPDSSHSSPRDDRTSPELKTHGFANTSSPSSSGAQNRTSPPSFIFIDDDVSVLRERLKKLGAMQPPPPLNNPISRKRPSLASFHRPRSSPHVARAAGFTNALLLPPPVVIVHFTSLANFKLVKDAVHSLLAPPNGPFPRPPEVIVIPKPAGPRRFLTALHTAVTKPIVDPFFSPIATSPISPGLHIAHPFFHQFDKSPRSPLSRPSRTGSDRSTRSPKEQPTGDSINLPPPSPLGMSDSMEYFSEAAVKLGTSPSSGLVIQSPDGSPAGIFFHPKAKVSNRPAVSLSMERDRGQFVLDRRKGSHSRRASEENLSGQPDGSTMSFASAVSSVRRLSIGNPGSPRSDSGAISPLVATPLDSPPAQGLSQFVTRKATQNDSLTRPSGPQPMSPRSSPGLGPTGHSKRLLRRPTTNIKPTSPSAGPRKPTDPSIVLPISVLIVDDNPINQTILSTFMRKKKIKYDVAMNGEEAVEKWRTGGFHLILMDIQMPVMDGIQATKEIRRLEKMSGSAGFPTPQSEGPRTPSDSASSATSVTTPYRSSVIIVALTASSLQSDRVAALAAGCNDFLTKPVSLLWLNNKIIEWGSIKALQMWADLRPEVVKSISSGQAAQAQNVAQRLHVPEGRSPSGSPSRSSSLRRKSAAANEIAGDKSTSGTPQPRKAVAPSLLNDESPGESPNTTPTNSDTSRQLQSEAAEVPEVVHDSGRPARSLSSEEAEDITPKPTISLVQSDIAPPTPDPSQDDVPPKPMLSDLADPAPLTEEPDAIESSEKPTEDLPSLEDDDPVGSPARREKPQ